MKVGGVGVEVGEVEVLAALGRIHSRQWSDIARLRGTQQHLKLANLKSLDMDEG